ncbi:MULTISPECIES: helix-turn-helix domain-containing protein [Streptomyces violaceusniger group]|uniref:helix-turn-helix domain-containing protein n=1 Tax=Streptomyces violaceusniger group TaxID=2839105 RepID=UPI000A3759E6|nr:helix-turn-helix domain-containing protein [Streptomyces rhizosphaericus]
MPDRRAAGRRLRRPGRAAGAHPGRAVPHRARPRLGAGVPPPLQDTRGRDLHTTLRAWIDANTDAQRTARHLGLSRNTVRAHLRAAEHLLSRDLLTTGSGIHDLVHALHITGLPPGD